MFIHFASLVDGNKDNYRLIVNLVSEFGHTLVTNHYLNRTINQIKNETPEESKKFHHNFIKWMKKADVIICNGNEKTSYNTIGRKESINTIRVQGH